MARRPPPASPACSPPVTSPITCIGRRSRPPAPAAWPRSTRIDTSRLSTRRGTARREAMALRPEFHRSIGELDPRQWNALGAGANPFTRHEFLLALERTHCVGRATGWEPLYLTLRDGGGLAAAVAAFVKTHSFGEFVFDFAWARAYEGVGRRYYPKLTVGAPFTPADRKSTRLNSSHRCISYAVFCLKKKKQTMITTTSKQLRASQISHAYY